MLQKEEECFNFYPTQVFSLDEKTVKLNLPLYYLFDTDIAFRMTVFRFFSPSQDLLIWFLPKNR